MEGFVVRRLVKNVRVFFALWGDDADSEQVVGALAIALDAAGCASAVPEAHKDANNPARAFAKNCPAGEAAPLDYRRFRPTTSLSNAALGELLELRARERRIPVIYDSLRCRIRMVGKAELFRIPLFGSAMRVTGFVEVDRHNRAQAVAALHGAEAALAAGTNIWIAPEGTRSETGKFSPFKKGGFHLALGAGARILPVSIDGTKDVLPAHSKTITPGQHVRVVISAPIDSKAFGAEGMPELMAAVRSAIAAHVPYA